MKLDIKTHCGMARYDFYVEQNYSSAFFPLVAMLKDLANSDTICQKSCNKYTYIRL